MIYGREIFLVKFFMDFFDKRFEIIRGFRDIYFGVVFFITFVVVENVFWFDKFISCIIV